MFFERKSKLDSTVYPSIFPFYSNSVFTNSNNDSRKHDALEKINALNDHTRTPVLPSILPFYFPSVFPNFNNDSIKHEKDLKTH